MLTATNRKCRTTECSRYSRWKWTVSFHHFFNQFQDLRQIFRLHTFAPILVSLAQCVTEQRPTQLFKYTLKLSQRKTCLESRPAQCALRGEVSVVTGLLLSLPRTPLMLSVLNGHTDCVYSLLNKGANVDAKDRWGRTALHRGVSRAFFPEVFMTSFYLKLNQAVFIFFFIKFLPNNLYCFFHCLSF